MYRNSKRNRAILLAIIFLIFPVLTMGQDMIPTLDLKPLFAKTRDIELHEDSEYAEKRIYTSSIDTLWNSLSHTENFDIADFIDDLILFKLRKGIDRLPDYSRIISLIISNSLSQRNIKDNDIEELLNIVDKLLIIDPYSYEAYVLKSSLILRKSYFYFIPALYNYFRGIAVHLSAIENRPLLIPSFIYLFHLALILAGFVFFLVIFIKYFPLIYHEVCEILNIERKNKAVLIIMFLIFVFWLFTGIIPLMVFFSAIVFVYMKKMEKIILIICFISLISSILSYDYFKKYTYINTSDITQALIDSYSKEYDPYSVLVLENYLKDNPDNIPISFALANFYQRRGKIFAALSLYNAILEKADFPEININVGNLYYLLNDYIKAQSFYEKVTENPKLKGIAFFNLAQLSLEKLTFSQDTHRYFELSKENYPLILNLYQKIAHKQTNLIIYVGLPEYMLQNHIMQETRKPSRDINFMVLGMDQNNMPFIGILSIAFILLFNLFRIRMDIAFRCKKCGKIFCNKCSTRFFSETICTSCHQVFFIKKGIHPKVRVEKIISIDRFKKYNLLLAKLLTVFTLGGGYILYEKTLKGFLLILIFIVLLLISFGFVPIFPTYTLLFVENFMLGTYFLIFLIVLVIFSIIKSIDKNSQIFHSEK